MLQHYSNTQSCFLLMKRNIEKTPTKQKQHLAMPAMIHFCGAKGYYQYSFFFVKYENMENMNWKRFASRHQQ